MNQYGSHTGGPFPEGALRTMLILRDPLKQNTAKANPNIRARPTVGA